MNKILGGGFIIATLAFLISNIAQGNQKKKIKNQNVELQSEKEAIIEAKEALQKQYADAKETNEKLRSEKEAIIEAKEELQKQYADAKNANKKLQNENDQFHDKEYKQQQQKKQREDEIKAIEDFELDDVNGLDDMEDI